MKYIIFLCALLAAMNIKAQNALSLDGNTTIPSYKLEISWHKTTLLIFPAPIVPPKNF